MLSTLHLSNLVMYPLQYVISMFFLLNKASNLSFTSCSNSIFCSLIFIKISPSLDFVVKGWCWVVSPFSHHKGKQSNPKPAGQFFCAYHPLFATNIPHFSKQIYYKMILCTIFCTIFCVFLYYLLSVHLQLILSIFVLFICS